MRFARFPDAQSAVGFGFFYTVEFSLRKLQSVMLQTHNRVIATAQLPSFNCLIFVAMSLVQLFMLPFDLCWRLLQNS